MTSTSNNKEKATEGGMAVPYNTALYHTRKDLGLCPLCRTKLEEGSKYALCKKCRDKYKARYHEQIKTETPEQHLVRNEINRIYQQQRRAKLRAEGLCIYCKTPAQPGYAWCSQCREKYKHRNKAYREKEKMRQEARGND